MYHVPEEHMGHKSNCTETKERPLLRLIGKIFDTDVGLFLENSKENVEGVIVSIT